MIKIILVDDEKLIRQGLKILLSTFPDIEVVGEAANGIEARDLCCDNDVDLALMDIRMPICNGIDGIKLIKEVNPNIKVLILTTFQDAEYINEGMNLGASGYLLKDSSHEAIYDGIKLAINNKVVLDNKISQILISNQNTNNTSVNKENNESNNSSNTINLSEFDITKKELEIIKKVAKGLNNKEISSELFLSEGTIKNNISIILSKLNLRDRTQLAIFAFENNLM